MCLCLYDKFEFIDQFKNKFLPIKHLLNLLFDLIISYFELSATIAYKFWIELYFNRIFQLVWNKLYFKSISFAFESISKRLYFLQTGYWIFITKNCFRKCKLRKSIENVMQYPIEPMFSRMNSKWFPIKWLMSNTLRKLT